MNVHEKPSVSGLMTQHHEVSRFENLFMKAIETAYYNEKWGLDWVFFLNSEYQIPINAFVSYLTQEAVKHGIVIENIDAKIKDFTLTMVVTIEGLTYEFNRGFK